VADIDQVRLRFVAEGIVDATFSYRGTPLFGYRAYQSEDGKSLTVGDIYDQVRVRAFDARKDLAVIQIPGFAFPRSRLATRTRRGLGSTAGTG
jgi:hypothetical protein